MTELLDQIIAAGEKATDRPWTAIHVNPVDAEYIYAATNHADRMAKALRYALDKVMCCDSDCGPGLECPGCRQRSVVESILHGGSE